MGSRGRSIRLRIYFLVAIPLIALVGLLAYIAGTLVNNAVNLDRAPSLINATGIPAAEFGTYVQAERAAAAAYLFEPTAANLRAYQAAVASTEAHEPAFKTAMTSAATLSSETAAEAAAINAVNSDLGQLQLLRAGVQARALTALDALENYSHGIADQQNLFLIEADSESDSGQLGQATGLIATIQAREQLSQEDALLAGMLAADRITAKNRIAFTDMAAARQADAAYAEFLLSPANLARYQAALAGSATMQQDLTGVEQAVAAGSPAAQLPVSQAGWQQLSGTLLRDEYNGGVAVADAILVADHQTSRSAWVKVAVTSGIALLGLLITILVSILIGRDIIRGLRGLERSARTLAEDQLPDVVTRLRRGEDVDVAAEAPPLRAGHGAAGSGQVSRDEISRVGQAFDQVRQTAIRAAVDEANLRRGLNDVFRSLARRSQSLLHRQLTLLDQMERRARDPEALDDLFRLDHLTTRMRRHAEGLVILAGAAPSRAWSSPVRMVDVMRGAIAEVEDYARVSVATRSQAALAGSAVADVIHLLAELVENATTLSPPYTSVRVSGDAVASGFVIEVEDRGLGMSPQRLGELNERLASPPEFNPSDSEQLGLFVVSQLAKRHGIRVALKASPYGGTSAVVLIPAHLVVTEEAFRAGLPGEPAAIGTGPDARAAASGNHRGPLPAGTVPAGTVPAGTIRADAVPADPAQADPAQAGPAQIGTAQIGMALAGPAPVGPVHGDSVPLAPAG
jgi:signal transduction histidine kinase